MKTNKRKDKEDTFEGIISLNSKAIGFVSPLDATGAKGTNRDEDIMIETDNLNTALHGDTVLVEILPDKIFNRLQGKVLKIVKRVKKQFVGTVDVKDNRAWLIPDDRRMYTDILLPTETKLIEKGRLVTGDKLLVEITDWQPGKSPVGTVLKFIGKKGEHNTEMESIILEKGFHSGFPDNVEREAEEIAAKAFPVDSGEIASRKDFRKTLTFTIDPKDAKDFDDALSFKKISDGRFEIGIHIADVSQYVQPGTALDTEAILRGCSVYLVDRTIPMLPHALSNNICSLNPHEDRLAFGAVFEMDIKGKIYKKWFGKTIIYSDKRFTYEEAQEVINKSQVTSDKEDSKYQEVLNILNTIAKIYIKENAAAGAISFETEEIKFELDERGVPLRVIKKQRLDTHKLIEQFMLLANREVAEFIHTKDLKMKDKLEGLMYRVHDDPSPEKIKDLAVLVRALGHNLPLTKDGEVTAKDLNALFLQIEGKAEESLIKTAAIRSMSKAIYTTLNSGHFGLAFEFYTHFTSPIRRYPDLVVHRILHAYLTGKKLTNKDVEFFAEVAESSTEREISAADAERTSVKYKQVEYWAPRVGAELSGVISGVSEWGVYVEENETKAEGMVRLKDMTDDIYSLDQKNYAVVGQKTGKKISLGDKVNIKLIRADVDKKTLDFQLI